MVKIDICETNQLTQLFCSIVLGIFIYVRMCTEVMEHTWRGENSFWESVFYFFLSNIWALGIETSLSDLKQTCPQVYLQT